MRVLIVVVVASVIGDVQTVKKPPRSALITIALPAGHGFTNAARHLVTLSPVNADGFDPPTGGPEFVLRAAQNVQALANSFVAADASIDFTANGRKSESVGAPGMGERRRAAP